MSREYKVIVVHDARRHEVFFKPGLTCYMVGPDFALISKDEVNKLLLMQRVRGNSCCCEIAAVVAGPLFTNSRHEQGLEVLATQHAWATILINKVNDAVNCCDCMCPT